MSSANSFIDDIQTARITMRASAMDNAQRGKYHVRVCTNISCMLRGGDELFERICKHYGVANRGRTVDGLVSVEEIACMGACENAPVVSLNEDFFEEVSVNDLPQLFNMIS